MGKATSYLPVIDLLKSYCDIEDRDDAGRIRGEKLTGKLLHPRPRPGSLPAPATAWPSWTCRWTIPSGKHSIGPSGGSGRFDAVKRLLLRESAGAAARSWCSRTCTGSIRRRRRLLDGLVEKPAHGAGAAPRHLSPGEYQHGWGSRTFYHPAPARPARSRRAPAALLQGLLLGDDATLVAVPQAAPDSSGPDGQPLLPGGERAHAGRDPRVGRRARGLPPGDGPAEHRGADDGAGDPGRPHRPPARR